MCDKWDVHNVFTSSVSSILITTHHGWCVGQILQGCFPVQLMNELRWEGRRRTDHLFSPTQQSLRYSWTYSPHNTIRWILLFSLVKWSLREVKWLAYSHMAGKWWGQNLNPVPQATELWLLFLQGIAVRTSAGDKVYKWLWQVHPWNKCATLSGYLFE